MPWREVSIMEQRREFVRLAMQDGVNRRELCRRFGIHPDTGYKWLGRFVADEELADRSRRPHSSPRQNGTPWGDSSGRRSAGRVSQRGDRCLWTSSGRADE